MKREIITPRPDAAARLAALGMIHAGPEYDSCWNEAACYHFSQKQIEEIECATAELHVMCMNAVQHVIDHKLYDRLKIPPTAVKYIEQSWAQRDPFIYGRFDLAYDGKHPPKMLEYNADTPTTLLEASLVQYHWLQQQTASKTLPADADQFNFIHESLIRAWKKARHEVTAATGNFLDKIHFATCLEFAEDAQTTRYMADIAEEAGITPEVMDMSEIGTDGTRFLDKMDKPIKALFKLYPWEFMLQDAYGQQALNNKTGFIEPAWKMLLSNKGIMAILWELYPNHPNLLPTYDKPGVLKGAYVTKPFISREGANITIHGAADAESNDGLYGKEGYIYQAYVPLPNFDGNFPIIGSWITGSNPVYPNLPTHPRGGEACGMGVREDHSRITKNASLFVPHYVTADLG